MGTKDHPQKSNLILGAALSVSILLGGTVTSYGVHEISNLENDIAKQHQVIETQGKKLEEQGSLTNQLKQENIILTNTNDTLTLDVKNYKALAENKDKQVKSRDEEIKNLEKKQQEIKQTETSAVPSRGETSNYKEFYVESTGYIALCQEGCSGITATGYNLKAHPHAKVIAVDPKVIPLGSKVYVEGYGYAVALDTGGGIDDYEIDLHFPTESQANEWGRKKVRIKVFN